ncbi:MAG: ribosome silencing factor [Rhodospirillales bacterium]
MRPLPLMSPALDPDLAAAITAAYDKQAENLVALDVSKLCSFTGFIVICHGNSTRHVDTIAETVRRTLKERGRRPHHVEGMARSEWVLMDYLDFVLHVFLAEKRQFYALEHLWGDARRLDLSRLPGASTPTSTAGGSPA